MKKLLLILLCLPMIGFGQNVNIPDANFKAYLVGNSAINTNGDTEIQVSEATAFNGSINCANMNLSDLTGIEEFSSLTDLQCSGNQISSLYLGGATGLTYLSCFDNQLISLDVSNNTALTWLNCYDNQLTSLNLNGATALRGLYAWNNQLISLDVSQNTSLISLFLNNNQLTSLDLSQISCSLQINESGFSENPNLNCVEVTDLSCWQNYIVFLDTSYQYYSTNCSGTSIKEYFKDKELLKVTDLLGRETKGTNQLLFYIYDDGTVEKRIVIE